MKDAPPLFALNALAAHYAAGGSPVDVVKEAYGRMRDCASNPIWITLVPEAQALQRAEELARDSAARKLPLFGVPFAVKDNIDVAGVKTTAACPAFAYVPDKSAQAVQRLVDAGAIFIGKTNLDQFATGLVGTRSPYGEVRNAFNPAYVSGGSSSGSAVAVALGLVAFALGTDTAGSGRVPAAFNNIAGLKPTLGRVSTRGVLAACRTLDCVSVFAPSCGDALKVCEVMEGHDRADPYSRRVADAPLRSTPVIGVPPVDTLEWLGDAQAAACFNQSIERLKGLGARIVPVDFEPFREAGRLLYEGPWVAERHASVGDFLNDHPGDVLPVIAEVINAAKRFTATDSFRAQYRMAEIACTTAVLWETIDALLIPTAATIFTRAQVEESPVQRNSELGLYTNFVNLLDLAAVAVPAGLRTNGLPFGITLVGRAGSDRGLCALGDLFHAATGMKLGALGVNIPFEGRPLAKAGASTDERIQIAVVGAHLSGEPLNHQLTDRGGRLVKATRTAARYRLYALADGPPARPGLVRDEENGVPIELEIWELGEGAFGSFTAAIPAPLGIGTLELEDGSPVKGFLCETYVLPQATDISSFGGWRSYLRSKGAVRPGGNTES